jgi:hypothetical protein
MYADKCWGEGDMHDTAMLLGAAGLVDYEGRWRSSRPTSAAPAPARSTPIFPVTPLAAPLEAQASSAEGYTNMPCRTCVILYTPNSKPRPTSRRCAASWPTHAGIRDEAGKQVFPTGGTRVLAYPAAHYAVADGKGDYGFMYLNVRMGAGRSAA